VARLGIRVAVHALECPVSQDFRVTFERLELAGMSPSTSEHFATRLHHSAVPMVDRQKLDSGRSDPTVACPLNQARTASRFLPHSTSFVVAETG
jgi:hypothetical protein